MVLKSNKKKTINLFAIGIILLVALPEIIGHSIFEKPHPENSSVIAAQTLANKIGSANDAGPSCHLSILNDSSNSKISRVAGLEGRYGNFTCDNP